MLLSEEIFDADGDLVLVLPGTKDETTNAFPTMNLASPSHETGDQGIPLTFANFGQSSIFGPIASASSLSRGIFQGTAAQPVLTPLGSSTLGSQPTTQIPGGPSLGVTDSSSGLSSIIPVGNLSRDPNLNFKASVPLAAEANPDIRMLVSSKHMMLASPVFKAMLNGNFKEGRALKTDGHTEVTLPDDDVTAFRIILNIIHGRNRRVPRAVDLNCLLQLAVLVDKYQMVEAVEAYSEAWITELKPGLLGKLRPDTGRWICISWAFGLKPEFKALTSILTKQLDGEIVDGFMDYLPLPEALYHDIASRRRNAIAELYGVVDKQITLYTGPRLQCPRLDGKAKTCDALMLGTMLRTTLGSRTAVWPTPPVPYLRVSFECLCAAIIGMDLECICDPPLTEPAYMRPVLDTLQHGIRNKFKIATSGVTVLYVQGLTLENYKGSIKHHDKASSTVP